MAIVVCVDAQGNQHKVSAEQLRWRPSAYAIVLHDGKILLAQEAGRYTLPGGGINLGEQIESALLREVKEETGAIVANPRPLSFASNFFALAGSEKGNYVQSILLYYQCDFVSGKLTLDYLPEEERPLHAEPVWLPLADLPNIQLNSSYDWRPLLQELLQSNT